MGFNLHFSLMANDVGPRIRCLLTMCATPPIEIFCPFLLCVFLISELEDFYFLETGLLSDREFSSICSYLWLVISFS